MIALKDCFGSVRYGSCKKSQVFISSMRWQMPAPPHSLHVLLSRWCWQMSLLLVADVAPAAAPDPLGQTRFPALPVVIVPPAARLAPASEPSGLRASMVEGAAVVKNGPHPLVPAFRGRAQRQPHSSLALNDLPAPPAPLSSLLLLLLLLLLWDDS